jgi:hypothetical protein
MVSLEAFGMAVLSARRLRDIRYDLHAAGNNSSRATTAGGIGGSGWSSKSFSQLFNQGDCDIVGCNVHGVSNTKDNK